MPRRFVIVPNDRAGTALENLNVPVPTLRQRHVWIILSPASGTGTKRIVMLDYLNAEIEKRKAQIAEIDSESERLRARRHDLGIELRTYENIRARLDVDEERQRARGEDRAAEESVADETAAGVKRTKLITPWRVVLRAAVERHPAVLKNSEVPAIQQAAGFDPSPSSNIRTHFHKLKGEGFYEDAGWGAVRATQAAAEFLGIPLGSISGAKHTEDPTEETLFGAPQEETTGQSRKAGPAASFHHNQGGPNGTALAN